MVTLVDHFSDELTAGFSGNIIFLPSHNPEEATELSRQILHRLDSDAKFEMVQPGIGWHKYSFLVHSPKLGITIIYYKPTWRLGRRLPNQIPV
jgi:hypothetical protein